MDSITIQYLLDWQGRRVQKAVDGSPRTHSIYEDSLQLSAEINLDTNGLKEYVFGTHINSADYMRVGASLYRIIKDHLGSPRIVVNTSTGEVVQRMDYNEWGKVTLDTNPGFQGFGYAGGLYDPDTKLVKFGARDYDGNIGRWLSKDPIGFDGGDENLYGYVLNDPVNSIDIYGLKTLLEGQIQGEIYAYELELSKLKNKKNCDKELIQKLEHKINSAKGDLALLKEGIKIRCGRAGAAAKACADSFAIGFPRSED